MKNRVFLGKGHISKNLFKLNAINNKITSFVCILLSREVGHARLGHRGYSSFENMINFGLIHKLDVDVVVKNIS